MRQSHEVVNALTTFFAKNASGDLLTFDEVVSNDEGVLAIGARSDGKARSARSTQRVQRWHLDPAGPATLSRTVITGLLRDRLGFRGVVMSDDLEMKAISSHYGLEQAVVLAVEAGIDVLCFGNNLSYDPDIAPKAIELLVRAVEAGRISPARIDASCQRVLTLKGKAGRRA